MLVPEAAPLQTGIVDIAGPGIAWSSEVEFEPLRRRAVSFVYHSHTDIGFIHPP